MLSRRNRSLNLLQMKRKRETNIGKVLFAVMTWVVRSRYLLHSENNVKSMAITHVTRDAAGEALQFHTESTEKPSRDGFLFYTVWSNCYSSFYPGQIL